MTTLTIILFAIFISGLIVHLEERSKRKKAISRIDLENQINRSREIVRLLLPDQWDENSYSLKP
jgi:hypothetical protein